jgi:hypothetical protein
MSENNVAFGLVRYDEVCAIALDRYLATSSISTRLEDLVGNHRHHAPLKMLCWILVGKGAADRAPRQRRVELSTIEVNRSRHREIRSNSSGLARSCDPLSENLPDGA